MALTPSAQYRLTIRAKIDDAQGTLGRLTGAIADTGGLVAAVDLVEANPDGSLRDIVVDAAGQAHWAEILAAIDALPGVEVIDTTDRTFLLHVGGKIEQRNKQPLATREDLSMVYTPGVARVCLAIAEDPDRAFQYTIKRNTVAVVSDGTAVLGLGDLGPAAAMPVMEGKACLFKEFAGVDAFPICLDTKDADEIVATVKRISPAFGGINLEDISAPRCFEIEERLKEELDIPVFHDDQHGTAVVVMAALLNAVKLTDRRLEDLRVLIIGLGAAGIAVTKIMLRAGVREIIGADSRGALHVSRADYLDGSMGPAKRWFAEATNPECREGSPADVIDGADLLIGVSGAEALPADALARMNDDAMVFAMANPNPEVNPEEAAPHVRIMATGRSDYPNQINNVLCFPGIFRGALDVRAPQITEEMKMAAARAIAAIVPDDELREDYIIPSVFNREVAPAVAAAVAEEARRRRHRARRAGGRVRAGRCARERDPGHGQALGGRARRLGTWRRSRGARDPHRRHRPARLRADRGPGGARRRGPGALTRSRARTRAAAERGGWGRHPPLGPAARSPRRRRRSPEPTRSCTWRERTSRSAGAGPPGRGSAIAGCWERTTSSRGCGRRVRWKPARSRARSSAPPRSATTAPAARSHSTRTGPRGEGFLAEVCEAWEHEAARASELGMRVVRLRTGVVLDPHGGALAKMLPPFRLGLGGPVAGGRQFVSWIHREDLVGVALAAILDERWSGPVNATAPAPVRNSELASTLGERAAPPGRAPRAGVRAAPPLRPDGHADHDRRARRPGEGARARLSLRAPGAAGGAARGARRRRRAGARRGRRRGPRGRRQPDPGRTSSALRKTGRPPTTRSIA